VESRTTHYSLATSHYPLLPMSRYAPSALNESVMQSILAMQANALNQGHDTTAWLVSRFAADTSPQAAELTGLLYLAQQLKRALTPVSAPRPLAEPLATAVDMPALSHRSPAWWLWAAVASSCLTLAAVGGVLLWRHGRHHPA
jgi:hypothetical protein